MIGLIGVVCSVGYLAWFYPSLFIRIALNVSPERGRRIMKGPLGWLRYELMPVRWLLLVGDHVTELMQGHELGPWGALVFALNLFWCWFYRQKDDEDDDRWKKRRKKLASKVAEVGGRLQVVPAGAR